MCAPSPPPAPDYKGAAQAQGTANVEAAQAASRLNNPNVISPYGTQSYVEGAGPSDRPTLTQAFSPEQQRLYEQQLQTKGLLGGLGTQGATALQGVVGKPVDFAGAPPPPGAPGQIRQDVIDAMMSRVTPDYNRAVVQKQSDLRAAGIPVGSEAYNTQMELLNRGLNDAKQQAIAAATGAAAQDYSQTAQSRQAAIAEQLAQRQVPLNEITALMSGSQVQNPFATPGYAQNAQIAPAPIFGAAQATGDYATDIYNLRSQQAMNLQSGLFSLGSSAANAYARSSDRRLKKNIRRIGSHPLGIGLYVYDLHGHHEIGVMADEVLTVKPEAVLMGLDGYLRVDYEQLVP